MPESISTTQELLDSVWGEKQKPISKKLEEFGITGLNEAPFINYTHDDIEYLCNYRYPYLQILNSETTFPKNYNLQFLLLPNHWVIYDYGDALSTAVSHFYRKDATDDDESEGEHGGGFGTIVMQQFDAVYAMVREAIAKGWVAIEIMGGTKLMQSYTWIAAQKLGIELVDYFPTSDDYRRYKLITEEKELVHEIEMRKENATNE